MANKPISDAARAKINQIIKDHHEAFAVEVIGPDAVSKQTYERLKKQGLLPPSVEHTQVSVQAAHAFGRLEATAPPKSDLALARMKPDKFWSFIALAPPQFSSHELDAMKATKEHVGHLISGLGAMISADFDQATQEEANKLRHEALAVVQHEISLGIARKQSKEQIERRLKKKLKDVQRDWSLIVTTELHNAKENGKALSIATGGRDPLVYKLTHPDACRFCKLLYLNGKKPRLFRLSELAANGTNYGRKAVHPTKPGRTQWRPVIGSVHPACQCELREMPAGHAFDSNGNLVQSMKKAMEDVLTSSIRALIGHNCEA